MRTYKYISIDRIFSILNRQKFAFDENDVVEMAGEALEFIGTLPIYEEAISFFEVKNYLCPIPQYLHQILQVGRNNEWRPQAKECTPKTIIEEVPNLVYQNCEGCGDYVSDTGGYVVLDGEGSPLVEYDIAYYRPYFDLLGEYYGWSNSTYYKNKWTPVRLANSTFFGSIVNHANDGSHFDNCGTDRYNIVGGENLRFNFPTGYVAIAHVRTKLDPKTGWPMIPDSAAHIKAIISYIKREKAEIDLDNRREGSAQYYDRMEERWQWYCGVAVNQDKMPATIDDYQDILDQRSYILPDHNKYYNFFGNLNVPEYRKYNDPDSRNNPHIIR